MVWDPFCLNMSDTKKHGHPSLQILGFSQNTSVACQDTLCHLSEVTAWYFMHWGVPGIGFTHTPWPYRAVAGGINTQSWTIVNIILYL